MADTMSEINVVLARIVTETLTEHAGRWTDGECECGAPLPVDGHAGGEVWLATVFAHQGEMVVARLNLDELAPQEHFRGDELRVFAIGALE